MFKKNKSLKTKLMLSFTIISFLLIIVGGIGQLFQSKIINSYDHIVSVNLPNAVVLGDMNQDLSFMAMGLLELSVSHELRPDEKNAIKEKIKLHLDSFEKLKATYEAIPPTVQGETEVYAPIKENWSKLKSMIETGIDKLLSDNREIQNAFIKNYQT